MVTGIAAEELDRIVARIETATNAFMQGDMAQYLALTGHVAGFTLMNPFGGAPTRYEDRRDSLMAAASYFRNGDARIELIDAHASGDLLLLVTIEHQHGEVGGLPDQKWSLRVTEVYRREGGAWLLLHRHADPLVTSIGLERAAELARL